jgi:hypothetical protein
MRRHAEGTLESKRGQVNRILEKITCDGYIRKVDIGGTFSRHRGTNSNVYNMLVGTPLARRLLR